MSSKLYEDEKNFVAGYDRSTQKISKNFIKPGDDRDPNRGRKKVDHALHEERLRHKRQAIQHRLTAMRRNTANIHGLAINVRTWAEGDFRTNTCWGDWWVKQRLEAAFLKMGHTVEVMPEFADITIYLWGSPFPAHDTYPFRYNPSSFNVAWFYSHPDKMTEEELRKYDLVFCLSPYFASKISKWGVPVEVLIGCTDMRPPSKISVHNDIVFVGNARGPLAHGRSVIRDLDPGEYRVKVFGAKWRSKPGFDLSWYGGQYFPYERLNELYAGATISLNDHHPDMAREGFVAVKIFDILASGGFCISDENKGVKQIFGDSVPMWRNANELNRLVAYYLKNKEKREALATKGAIIARKHTYPSRAQTMLEAARQLMGV